MRFDVVITNPPYHKPDGGHNRSATAPYPAFIEKAKALNPRYLSMIIPARWYSGGKGLDSFRETMLHDRRIKVLVDYERSKDVFKDVDIKGGVCYFLWDREYEGDCRVVNMANGEATESERRLDEFPVFIRRAGALPILRKVLKGNEGGEWMSDRISKRLPFGIQSYARGAPSPFPGSLHLYRFKGTDYVHPDTVTRNSAWIDKYKVLISKASAGQARYPDYVLSAPIVAEPGSVCTDTYMVAGVFDEEAPCLNLCSYLKSRFLRFLVLLVKHTQNAACNVYRYVPVLNFDEPWPDSKLYARYGITAAEQALVESMVRERE